MFLIKVIFVNGIHFGTMFLFCFFQGSAPVGSTTVAPSLGPSSLLPSLGPSSCEPLTISACQDLGYTQTPTSQLFGNQSQAQRGAVLQQVSPLFRMKCSPDFKLLMCTMTAPKCNPVTGVVTFPCRSLCKKVKKECEAFLKSSLLSLPQNWLNCAWMPESDCVSQSTTGT